ncbi:hypothetical protein Tco_0332318, partial [Tanacetum coccineum]
GFPAPLSYAVNSGTPWLDQGQVSGSLLRTDCYTISTYMEWASSVGHQGCHWGGCYHMREVSGSSLSVGVFLQGGNMWGSAP